MSGPRFGALRILLTGVSCLALNHAIVVVAEMKYAALVFAGAFLTVIGVAGLAMPQLLTAGATGEKIPWWGRVLGGAAGLGGIALGFFLWFVMY